MVTASHLVSGTTRLHLPLSLGNQFQSLESLWQLSDTSSKLPR